MKNKIFVGDNFNVLNSSAMEEFAGKVGLIYIDPPYNNGSQFSFDNCKTSQSWAEYISKRISSCYRYLAEDAAIFVSIDDTELATLKLIMDDVFGKKNFVGTFITRQAQRSNSKHINTIHEYVLCYAKNKKKLPAFKINRIDIPADRAMIQYIYKQVGDELKQNGYNKAYKLLQNLIKSQCEINNISWLKNYNNLDYNGKIYFAKDLSTPGEPKHVDIEEIDLHLKPLATRGWVSNRKFIELYNNSRLVFKDGRPYAKQYLEEAQDNAPSILNFYSRQGSNALKKLGINKLFDTPKPVEMIKFFIRLCCKKNSYILDAFAGSGTTAQAVYEVNDEDNTNRKYLLIQLNENVNPKSEVYEECRRMGVEPKLQYILKYRIDLYLRANNKKIDYDFYDV